MKVLRNVHIHVVNDNYGYVKNNQVLIQNH